MVGWNAGLPQGQIIDRVMQTTGLIPLRGEAPTDYQRNGTTVRVRGFERHPVVQACVRTIVELACCVPLQAYRKVKPTLAGRMLKRQPRTIIDLLPDTHPAQKLVDSPSPFFNALRYRATTYVHDLVYGNALWFLERPLRSDPTAIPEPPQTLRLIHPEDLFTVYVNNKAYPIWYMWRDILGYPHTSPVTDIMHFRDLNAKGFVFGYPRAASALNDIIGDDEASQHVRQIVTNHGAPPTYAIGDAELTPDQASEWEAVLYEKWVKRGERGRFAILGGVKDIKSVGFNLKDLEQFPDLRRVAREDICAAFGTDPRIVGITSASRDAGLSGTQYSEARLRLIEQTVKPLLQRHEAELNQWLAPEFGDVYYRFDPDVLAALGEDDTTTSARIVKEVAAAIRTIEEGRDALDLPPEFPEGDTLTVPSLVQIVPVAIALAGPQPVQQVGPDGKPIPGAPAPTAGKSPAEPAGADDADPSSGDAGSTDKGAAMDQGTNLVATTGLDPNAPDNVPHIVDGSVTIAKKRVSAGPILIRGVVLPKEQRAMLWKQFDARAAAEEAPFRQTALLLFAEERSNVGQLFGRASNPKQARSALRLQYKPEGTVAQRWTDRMHPLIGATFAKGAHRLTSSLRSLRSLRADPPPKKQQNVPTGVADIGFDFHLEDPDVQQAIRDRAATLAGYVTATTADAIDSAIAIGLREGMSMDQIADLVDQTAFGAGAGWRATMIARTESIGALNQGQYTAALDSEQVEGKEWLTQNDDRVRDSHADCEDQGQIPISEAFDNGLQHPGDQDGDADEVVNCRCTLLYYDTLGTE